MNQLLEKIKIIASIKDDEHDEILRIHIDNSINAIMVYLNNPSLTIEKIICNYPNAIIQLVKRQYVAEKEHLTGVSSMSQGSRSISYASAISSPYSIDDTIKALLPRPFLRLY